MHLEKDYTSVFDQCSSPCGKYLACCSNFGRISIFNLQDASINTNEVKKCHYSFKMDKLAYCLITCGDMVLCGMNDGEIKAYKWDKLIKKISNESFTIPCPANEHYKQVPPHSSSSGVGSMCLNASSLYSSHTSTIHQWDLNDNFKHTGCFKGHEDHIHDLSSSQHLLHSASEDGSVISWDLKSGKKTNIIIPTSDENCVSPIGGKWVKCAAVAEDKDYIVVGGGFRMSLWYPSYKSATTIFNRANVSPKQKENGEEKMEVDSTGDVVSKGITNDIVIHNGTIMSCGNSNKVATWASNGDLISTLPCSSFNLYSINVNQLNPKLLTVAGSSNLIDACINYNYKSFCLQTV